MPCLYCLIVMKSYPSGDHDLLYSMLEIPAGAAILDVGGGANPFKYAGVVVDMDYSFGNRHRDGSAATFRKHETKYVQADIQALPFKDGVFDFAVCMHVLEHVEFPDKACDELMRVAGKGFLETPRKWSEYYAGHPTHRWLVDEHDRCLTFEPLTYNNSPFMNFALPPLWDSSELQQRLFIDFSSIPCVQLAWDGAGFKYTVLEPLPDMVKSNAFFAENHYCFASNLLMWQCDFKNGAFHAGIALKMEPDSEKYRKMLDFYTVLTGGIKKVLLSKTGLKLIAAGLLCRFLRVIHIKILSLHRKMTALLEERIKREN